jgi:hypothetical protein
MIKAPVSLQDLRRRIYVKGKADTFCGTRVREPGDAGASAGGGGVSMGCTNPLPLLSGCGVRHPLRKVAPAR